MATTCIKCIHFDRKTKKCKKWGRKAVICREDDMMCGARAWDFEEVMWAPTCISCKHHEDGVCKVFCAQNPMSGEIFFLDSIIAREQDNLCGEYAYHYEEEDFYD
jgi:hypothetical protein